MPESSDLVPTSTTDMESASDRFRNKLSGGSFTEALVEIFTDLVQLEIVTWVAHEGDTTHRPGNRLRTSINLIDGDIENEVGADFLDNSPWGDLRSFHEEQVAKASDTIQNNIKTIMDIGQKVGGMLSGGGSAPASEDTPLLDDPKTKSNSGSIGGSARTTTYDVASTTLLDNETPVNAPRNLSVARPTTPINNSPEPAQKPLTAAGLGGSLLGDQPLLGNQLGNQPLLGDHGLLGGEAPLLGTDVPLLGNDQPLLSNNPFSEFDNLAPDEGVPLLS